VKTLSKLSRLHIYGLLLGIYVIGLCPSIAAQGPAALDDSSSVATGSISSSPAAESSSSSSPTAAQTTENIGPSVTRSAGNPCDLAAPLGCIKDVLHDQVGIWTAPARLRGRKLLWLLPIAGATALAFEYDVQAMNALGPSPTRIRASNDFTHVGSGYVLVGAAALTYAIGRLEHKQGPREAGMLALEAVADASLVTEFLKLATNRQRPFVAPGTGKFWPDDSDIYTVNGSFPSGHAAATWAFARVMVEETPGHPWLHVLLYGIASGVSIARVTGQNHFPSDALVGSVIGYTVGGYVYRHHSQFYLPKASFITLEPLYSPATASYGASLSFHP
jgi:membrane-associated phospholipid phosphatase